MSENLEDLKYCNACHKLEHAFNEPCPEFAELCDICNTSTINYAEGNFWNCLCETCWNKEKDLI